jgi:hypothetical protein
MHYGERNIKTYAARGPGGQVTSTTRSATCYLNAECIAQHGVATEGDALAEIECTETHCVCRIEFLDPRPSQVEFRFESESRCESAERDEALLREWCIKQPKRGELGL